VNQAVRRQVATTPAEPPVSPRALVAMVITLGVLAILGYVGQSLSHSTNFPIRKVAVEGNFLFLTPGYIQALVSRSLHGGFFQVDVQEIRSGLLEEPWVRDAQIERRWPDIVRVRIEEQQPTARWGEHALLNTAADVFAPNPGTFPRGLPRLNGPVGSELEVLTTYRMVTERMRALGLKVASLELSERGAWTVGLEGETRLLLGRHRIEERLERFRAAYDLALKATWPEIASVDLRYTNGLAIRERAPRAVGPGEGQRGG